jgi:tRNA wybutosine-synthesizing protein 1
MDSLKALRDKNIRTVYRLTLVKGMNAEDVQAYADLIRMGDPHFIEVKGVTFCGKVGQGGSKDKEGSGSGISMSNVPWHSEVVSFCQDLVARIGDVAGGGGYEVAAEHEHSNCVLIASKRCP